MSIIDAPVKFESLRAELVGDLALPGEPGYELSTPWNVAVAVTPAAVVLAQSPDDVAATVRFAATAGLRVAVMRTGHGTLPMGDDVVLVHTGRLDEISPDVYARRVRVGAGVVWQQVLDVATPHGLAPLVGSAPASAWSGSSPAAGSAPLVRTTGLCSDRVLAFDLVTGDGRQLRVTPTRHAELFWGLRGGKGTLGIVTAVEFELLPIAEFYGGRCISTVPTPPRCCTPGVPGPLTCPSTPTPRSHSCSSPRCRWCRRRWPGS